MRSLRSLSALFILGAILATDAYPADTQKDDHEARARVLEAAHLQWLHDTDVVCRFRMYQATPASMEEGRKLSHNQMTLEGEGLFVKLGETVRLTYQPARKPSMTTSDGGAEMWKDLPFDEVSNDGLQIRFGLPFAGREKTSLTVELKEGKSTLPFQAGTATRSVMTPLYIAGRRFNQPYSFDDMGNREAERRIHVRTNDSNDIAVEISLDTPPWHRQKTVVFHHEGSIPVIREVSTLDKNQTTGQWIETLTEGSQFVECPGGPIAKEMRYLLNSKGRATCKMRLWISDDLGAREPQQKDFDIEIPKETVVRGLKERMPSGSIRHINIFNLTADSLGDFPNRGESESETNPETQRSARSVRWFIIINVVGLLLIVGLLALQRSRRRL